MKNFARFRVSAQIGQSSGAENNRRHAAAAHPRAAGIATDEAYPVPEKLGTGISMDRTELRVISERWGAQFADALITDRRWPACNQPAAIRAAGMVVERAIIGIVAILDTGDDFKPHTKMMAATVHAAFWNSMPSPGKKGKENAPTA
jgi:hypothetical protein